MNLEENILQHLLEKYNPWFIFLHGSRAVHKNRQDSDWDIYVFTKDTTKTGSATEVFEGYELDVSLQVFPFEITKETLVATFGPTLQTAEILFDKNGDGKDFLNKAQLLYAEGRKLSDREIEDRKRRFARVLLRLKGSIHDDYEFFYHMTSFYPSIIRWWFELRGEWSKPIYLAMREIMSRDEEYYNHLSAIVRYGDNHNKVVALEKIYKKLFSTH